jgi:hypothetical protein
MDSLTNLLTYLENLQQQKLKQLQQCVEQHKLAVHVVIEAVEADILTLVGSDQRDVRQRTANQVCRPIIVSLFASPHQVLNKALFVG